MMKVVVKIGYHAAVRMAVMVMIERNCDVGLAGDDDDDGDDDDGGGDGG